MRDSSATTDLQRGHVAGIGILRRKGEDPARPLILLHGIGSNADSFAELILALPPSIETIAWNAPGYADSLPLAEPAPSPQGYAEALERLFDALGLRSAVLVGHSLGALFAARFAAMRPDLVDALALLSPALGYRIAATSPMPPIVQARIDDLRTLGPQRFAAKRAPGLVGDPEARPDVVAKVERVMAKVDPGGYAQAVRALAAGDLLGDSACIGLPTAVAVGSLDRITPPDNARAAHARLKGDATYHEVQGAGHALPQEQPGVVARILVGLMQGIRNV